MSCQKFCASADKKIIVNACARRLGSRAGPEHAVCGDDAWRRPLGESRPTGASQWEGLVGGAGAKYAYWQGEEGVF